MKNFVLETLCLFFYERVDVCNLGFDVFEGGGRKVRAFRVAQGTCDGIQFAFDFLHRATQTCQRLSSFTFRRHTEKMARPRSKRKFDDLNRRGCLVAEPQLRRRHDLPSHVPQGNRLLLQW